MNPTAQIVAMADPGAPVSMWAMLMSLGALLLSLMLPVAAIAWCVTRCPVKRVDGEIGLGSVSLHDEMWEFIGAVERGDVSFASLGATAENGGESVSKSPSPVERGKLAS